MTTNRSFQTPYLFSFLSFLAFTKWNAPDCEIYQRRWGIHPCCLQKFIRWRFLSRQDVTGSLHSDVPCCLFLPPYSACGGSIFQLLDAARVCLDTATAWGRLHWSKQKFQMHLSCCLKWHKHVEYAWNKMGHQFLMQCLVRSALSSEKTCHRWWPIISRPKWMSGLSPLWTPSFKSPYWLKRPVSRLLLPNL